MKVVVGVVSNDFNQFAFLQRVNGVWTFPSGKVEPGEGPLQAVVREVKEETGLDVSPSIKLGSRTADGREIDYYACRVVGGVIENLEKDKFLSVQWKKPCDIIELAGDSLFIPVKSFLEAAEKLSMPRVRPKKIGKEPYRRVVLG